MRRSVEQVEHEQRPPVERTEALGLDGRLAAESSRAASWRRRDASSATNVLLEGGVEPRDRFARRRAEGADDNGLASRRERDAALGVAETRCEGVRLQGTDASAMSRR